MAAETDITAGVYKHALAQALKSIYDQSEAEAMARIFLEEKLGRHYDIHSALAENQLQMLSISADRLKKGEPLQYVLGYAWFRDLQLSVNQHVLIPRPETEELVDLVLQSNPRNPAALLDIGTGSGAIALALKKEWQQTKVFACDISPKALEVVKENADALHSDISCIQADVLEEAAWDKFPSVDMIVSNPPYIPAIDKADMHTNVLDWEPALALFVADDEPLVFYQTILDYGRKVVHTGGKLYFEIHHAFPERVSTLAKQLDWKQVQVFPDMQGKPRMMVAVWEGF